jgi:hypothetical protein
MPDGGIRRVWVTKAAGHYFCALEECTPAQEEARGRLFAGPNAVADEARRRADLETWSAARFDQIRTADANAAFAFLGRDAAARGALLAADPALDERGLG